MKVSHINDYLGGWYIGNFFPVAYQTDQFEVCLKNHFAGEKWDVHFHKIATEINLLVKGKMMIQNRIITEGEIFILEPNEIADPQFLEDCLVVVIKTPSVPGDKFRVGVNESF